MKHLLKLLRSALITGLLIVLPAWLAVLLLVKLLVKLGVLVTPLAARMPAGIDHPHIIAAFVFIPLCLSVGILVRTAIGRVIGKTLGENVFKRIPGYQHLRNIARHFSEMNANDGFKPTLIEAEDGCLAPAFLIDVLTNRLGTVYMHSVPTPMAGSIVIMPGGRVRPIDVPTATMMKCISKWGSGTAELLAALENPTLNSGTKGNPSRFPLTRQSQ